MPDFERVIRDAELHCAVTTEEKAFALGKHQGADNARIQIVKVVLLVAALVVAASAYFN